MVNEPRTVHVATVTRAVVVTLAMSHDERSTITWPSSWAATAQNEASRFM